MVTVLFFYPIFSVSPEFAGLKDYRAVVYSDGTVYYNFPTIVEAL
jgi:hypothetical protein